jgi:DNA-directed RNA polymerase specialized sigma24 family protein
MSAPWSGCVCRGCFASSSNSLDFVQAVWKSVLTAWDDKESGFDSPGHFRCFLAAVARNKVLAEYRRRTRTRKYDLGREEPLTLHRAGCATPKPLYSNDPTRAKRLRCTTEWTG